MIEDDEPAAGRTRSGTSRGRAWRIYPPYLCKLMVEAVLIWAVLRFVLTMMADEPIVAAVSVLLLGACALLVGLDLRLMRERIIFMNLGVPAALLVGRALLPAILCELVIRWMSRAYLA